MLVHGGMGHETGGFVYAACANGQQVKYLTLVDAFTRKKLVIDVAGSIRAVLKWLGFNPLMQRFEKINQISQIFVTDIPARHVSFQLCAIGILTFHNSQPEFFSIKFGLQG